jgi:uncharacterized protein (TIGR03083 family)
MTVAPVLAALRERSQELTHTISDLTWEEWQRESNCPPWRVHDLAAHVVTSGRGFIASIKRGLAGTVDPPDGPRADLGHAEPAMVAQALSQVTAEFESLYDRLSDAELETICWHRRGNRSVRWYASHRLAEVAFHGWDLETSLGYSRPFPEEVARLLLPMLLESNVPRTYAAGLSEQRGRGERYLLRVQDDPSLTWQVTIDPEELRVSRGDGPAAVQVTASAAELALLVYGRAELRDFPAIDGDPAMVERFAHIFPRP